jgi:hypothetical protein
MDKILVCQFQEVGQTVLCKQPIGRHPQFGSVYLDRSSEVVPQPGVKYICRLVQSQGRSHLVVPIRTAKSVISDLLPQLTAAEWQRGAHITDDVKCEITSPQYGCVAGMWYESTSGRLRIKFVRVRLTFEGEDIELSLEDREDMESIAAIQKRVRQCVGPAVDIGAAIARQSESQRTRARW